FAGGHDQADTIVDRAFRFQIPLRFGPPAHAAARQMRGNRQRTLPQGIPQGNLSGFGHPNYYRLTEHAVLDGLLPGNEFFKVKHNTSFRPAFSPFSPPRSVSN